MVTGIDKFREHFAVHESQYAIIGGTACDLLFDAAGLLEQDTLREGSGLLVGIARGDGFDGGVVRGGARGTLPCGS